MKQYEIYAFGLPSVLVRIQVLHSNRKFRFELVHFFQLRFLCGNFDSCLVISFDLRLLGRTMNAELYSFATCSTSLQLFQVVPLSRCVTPLRRPRTSCVPRGVGNITMAAKPNSKVKAPTVENRIARNRYEFLETFECGIELFGTEIKAIRDGKMNLKQGYARVKDGELFLHNVHISHWRNASKYFNHDPLRPRRLLLHKRSIRKLEMKQKDSGLTIVPTRAYFNGRGFLKMEIALARGKQLHDKREDIKRREQDRDARRIIKSTLSA